MCCTVFSKTYSIYGILINSRYKDIMYLIFIIKTSGRGSSEEIRTTNKERSEEFDNILLNEPG